MNTKLHASLAIFSAIGLIAALTGCHTPATKTSSATPCMDVLPLFTAANVPAMGPDETPAPAGRWTNGITPPNLPGKGLAQHPMLIVGENYDKMFLVNDGKIIWTYQTGDGHTRNTTMCGCFPTATFFSPAWNTSPKSRRTKKWSGVMIATKLPAPTTRKSTPASPSAWTRSCSW